MDYVHRTLRFDLLVWIGDMADANRRDLYRPARLILDNVAFLVIEPPDIASSWSKPGEIRIDAGEGLPGRVQALFRRHRLALGRHGCILESRTGSCFSPLEMLHLNGPGLTKSELIDLQSGETDAVSFRPKLNSSTDYTDFTDLGRGRPAPAAKRPGRVRQRTA